MGLDTTHDAWHGAYSGFSEWRNALAEAAGYPLETIDSGGYQHKVAAPLLDARWTDANYDGDWGNHPPEDPLLILLVHSDCDGSIKAKHCQFIAGRLEQLLPKLTDEYAIRHTVDFIAGARRAHAANEDIEFY